MSKIGTRNLIEPKMMAAIFIIILLFYYFIIILWPDPIGKVLGSNKNLTRILTYVQRFKIVIYSGRSDDWAYFWLRYWLIDWLILPYMLYLKNRNRYQHVHGTKMSRMANFIFNINSFMGLKINAFWVIKEKTHF